MKAKIKSGYTSAYNSKKAVNLISYNAMAFALILAFTFIPNIGYIMLGPIAVTTVHVITLFFCFHAGKKRAWIYGMMFGISSFIASLMSGSGLNLYFQNPLVSILPRVIFAEIAGILFDLVKKIKEDKIKYTMTAVVSLIATMFHTLLVMGCLFPFYTLSITNNDLSKFDEAVTGFLSFFVPIMSTSFIFEALLAFFVVPLISFPFKRKIEDFLLNNTIYKRDRSKTFRSISKTRSNRGNLFYFCKK